jgi:type I restriction enzyme S subunit
MKELKSHIDILSGFAFNSKLFNQENKGMPLIRIRDVGKNFSKTFFTGDFDEKFIVKKGDLLIGMDGDFRLSEWKGNNALLNQRVCKIWSKDKTVLDDKYLLFLLPRELKFIEDTTSYATVKHLSVKKIQQIKIPLPKLKTQKKIAAILDEADKVRQLNKELIVKYDALTQSLFLEMFGKLDENIIELGEVIKLIGGGTPSKDKEEYWNGNIPWASVKDLKSDRLSKTVDKITIEGVNNSVTKIIPKGSLIVATRMAVGRATICEMDVAINQDLKAIKIIENVNVVYLQSLFKSKEKYFDSVSSGATVKGIKIEHITRLKIPIPSLEVQNQFAERVQIIENQKQQAKESLQKSEDLFNSLLQKAFKGELVK